MLKNESRNDKFRQHRADDGIKQRKLKNEQRWKFDPKKNYNDFDDEDDDYEEYQHGQ